MGESKPPVAARRRLLSSCVLLASLGAHGCGARDALESQGSPGAGVSAVPVDDTSAGVGGSAGGQPGLGGSTTTGDTAGGIPGAGCAGSFEATQNVDGGELCVASMVTIPGPGGADYAIDATEVTQGQYADWVATDPRLPTYRQTPCGWKFAGSYAPDPLCMTSEEVCQGPDCDRYPVVCVDWCDAYAYCEAVGKRLCGRIAAGSDDSWDNSDADESQWYRACSSAGANRFPYGETFQATACNAYGCAGSGNAEVLPVASFGTCQSSVPGFAGVYDLSGNVWEWEDSCYETVNARGSCSLRGGSFDSYSSSGYSGCDEDPLMCAGGGARSEQDVLGTLGFRCCSL